MVQGNYGLTFLGNDMYLLFNFFCSLLLFTSCNNSILHEVSTNASIVMNLSANTTKISQSEKTVTLLINIKNTSTDCCYILNFPEFSTYEHTVFQLIIEKNKQRKISADNLLDKKRIPKANDYKKLLPGESLTFKYKLDFSLLADEIKKLGQTNVDFGIYKIKILFTDKLLIKKQAINLLESNIIEIEYTQ